MNLLLDLFLTFARVGAFTFGGGYAMLALLDHECVEKKKWLTGEELTDITVIAESTPGPIAINCATYTGQKLAGMPGAIIATLGMILPSFLMILLISTFFENLLTVPIVAKAFRGIRLGVGVLIIHTAVKMIRRLLNNTPAKRSAIVLIVLAFSAVLVLNLTCMRISTIYLILASGAAGYALYGRGRQKGERQ